MDSESLAIFYAYDLNLFLKPDGIGKSLPFTVNTHLEYKVAYYLSYEEKTELQEYKFKCLTNLQLLRLNCNSENMEYFVWSI